jgi:hypothetical protein
MKKVMMMLVLFAFVAAVSTAYACGEKAGSKADAEKSKAEMTAASEATVMPAVVTSEKDVTVEKAGSGCCPGKTGVSKASAYDHCGAQKADVKVEKAMVKKAGARAYNCPASEACPTPCNKGVESSRAKSSSASVDTEAETVKVISTSVEATVEDGTLK